MFFTTNFNTKIIRQLMTQFKNFTPAQRFFEGSNILIFCIVTLDCFFIISMYVIHVYVIIF